MPLFHHAGALGDFLLSLPFLRAILRARPGGDWTLAAPEEHARLVSRLFPHRGRISPGSLELGPFSARVLDPARIEELAARLGGLFGFVPRAEEVEEILRRRRPDLPVTLLEPLSASVPAGRSIEESLANGIERSGGGAARPAPLDFAIREDELPPLGGPADETAGSAFLHPGSSDPAKAAPIGLFHEIAGALEARGLRAVWIRGPVEAERGALLPPGRALDRPDLVRLAHAISRAAAYVGNDSGPTHLASALGAPTLALHARSNPAWRPRGARSLVLDLAHGPLRASEAVARLLDSAPAAQRHGA